MSINYKSVGQYYDRDQFAEDLMSVLRKKFHKARINWASNDRIMCASSDGPTVMRLLAYLEKIGTGLRTQNMYVYRVCEITVGVVA